MKEPKHLTFPLVLLVLLALWPLPVQAYYPPVQASASYSGNTVVVDVWDPVRQIGSSSSLDYPGPITNLQQQNGVIAWVWHEPAASGGHYLVKGCTYDPYLGKLVFFSPYLAPTQPPPLIVQDGVIAYISNDSVVFTTYDPESASWIDGSQGIGETPSNLYTRSGIVAWRISYSTVHTLYFSIYDPLQSKWVRHHFDYSSTANFDIQHGSVVLGDAVEGSYIWGYDSSQPWSGGWGPGYTKTLAHFVAQPTSGKRPLGVWFTDMSIGGEAFSWDFGDKSTSSSISPYHLYSKSGHYMAKQTATSGMGGTSSYSTAINVRVPLSFLPLLLID